MHNASGMRRLSPAVPFILAGCTAVSVLSTDLVAPSIPDIPEQLGGTVKQAQMIVSVNLLAYALAQLVHGPVADAIGRKKLLLVSFSLFAVASVICALAGGITWLLGGRFLQGLFSSVPSVVIVLLIRELYGGQRALGVMALYGMALGVAPAIGPLLGGYLHVWFGWQAGFWFIALLALTTAAFVWWLVPESLEEPIPINVSKAIGDYARLLATPAYLRLSLAISLGFAAYFSYVTTAPVVIIDILGVPTQQYGLTNLVIIACFVIGNLIASQLKDRLPLQTIFMLSFAAMLAGMAFLLVSVLVMGPQLWLILGAMGVYAIGLAFQLAAGPIVVLNEVAEHPQGAASALLGSMQLGISSLGGFLSAKLFDGTALPMVLVMSGLVVAAALLMFAHWRSEARAGQALTE